jgi:hypothetical protein
MAKKKESEEDKYKVRDHIIKVVITGFQPATRVGGSAETPEQR